MKKSLVTLTIAAMIVAPGAAFAGKVESQMQGISFWKTDTVDAMPVRNSRMVGKNLWKSEVDGSLSVTSKMAGKSLYKQNLQTAGLAKKVAK
ncbi:MAG: hypothetical protein ACE5EN_07385 [Nitrospinota bacterium]